jgi:S-formylglutathione hydrolase
MGTYCRGGESLISSLLGGCNIKGEDDSWDFGTGAGFYVNATEDPWKANYRMYSYVTEEVISLIS